MAVFAVRRKIEGKAFLRDEDRIIANDWDGAITKLIQGWMNDKYDSTCVLDGMIVYEEEVDIDVMLDIMNSNK